MSHQLSHSYSFGPYRLNVTDRLLLRDERSVQLPQKAFETLLTLVENNSRVVSKDELMSRLWPDTFVEENNLAHYISLLRKTLGSEFIETVPKIGYRFVASVREIRSEEPGAVFIERTRTH